MILAWLNPMESKPGHEAWNAALAASDSGDTAGALRLIDQAIHREPAEWRCLLSKGRILHEAGRFNEAQTVLEDALKRFPDAWPSWGELGMLNYRREYYELAAFCFQELLKHKEDESIYTLLASSQLTFDPPAALENAKKALAIAPNWEEAHRITKRAEDLIERYKATGRYWEEKQNAPDSEQP